jgi:GNAT superfamily N-acetyltransferase
MACGGVDLIRLASPADAENIARLGARFFDEAGWSDCLEYNEADCRASLEGMIGQEHFICLVSGDPIDGMIAGLVGPAYFNASQIMGEELFWWSEGRTGLRLLAALEDEARNRGCIAFTMKSLARLGGDRMAQLYQRRGYRPSESAFIKGL